MLRGIYWMLLFVGLVCCSGALAQESTVTPTDTGDKVVAASLVNAEVSDQPFVQPAGNDTVAAGSVPQPRPTVMEFDVNAAGNVTLDFREADIKNVLKVLAYKSGVNIIAGPEVVGLVNIKLTNVPWLKALEVILTTYGYSYDQKGTIITVTTVDILKKRREDSKALADQEPLSTETFVLSFSRAEDVVKTLDKMKSPRGSINFDQRTNSVIVTDVETQLVMFRDVVNKLDTVTPQILIEARIIETALNKQEKMGIVWPTSLGGTAVFPVRTHSFPWSNKPNTYMPSTEWTNPESLTYGTLTADSLSVALDILNSRSNTNSLSNPSIVTLDNQPAKIVVGNKYPLPKYSLSETQDKLMVSGWEYIEYGLTFRVTPHINGKDMITLDIEPEVVDSSSYVDFDFGGTETTKIPVLSTQSAKTNVMIRDGETLVIAGLIKDKKTKSTDKVPLLGDIPLLGLLFRHKDDEVIKTELLIFLTPRIITATVDRKPAVK